MVLLLPAYGGADDAQQLLVGRPRAQQIPQRHLRVPKQTHLGRRGPGRRSEGAFQKTGTPGITADSGKKQTFRCPSAVRRRRLQEPQKWSDMDVMKPT